MYHDQIVSYIWLILNDVSLHLVDVFHDVSQHLVDC